MKLIERVLGILRAPNDKTAPSGPDPATPGDGDGKTGAGTNRRRAQDTDDSPDHAEAWPPGFTVFVTQDRMRALLRWGGPLPLEPTEVTPAAAADVPSPTDDAQPPADAIDDDEAPTDEYEAPLDDEAVYDLATAAGVIVGFDEEAVAHAVTLANRRPRLPFEVEIARGTDPVPAVPPSLELGYRSEIDGTIGSAVEVLELVAPDRVLVQRHPGTPAVARMDLTGRITELPEPPAMVLVAGENTWVSKDGATVKSLAVGYPRVERSATRATTRVTVHVDPVVKISGDRMEARLGLFRPIEGAEPLDASRAQGLLRDAGVTFGVSEDAIESVLSTLEGGASLAEAVVASGQPPQDGEDARVEFMVDLVPRPGSEQFDGHIDYRQRHIFQDIAEGVLIARKIPATKGTAGSDVLGTKLPARPGADAELTAEGDTVFDRKTQELRSTKAGVLTLVGAHRVRVSAKQIIDGDVDYSTGNIKSEGCVEVRGCVRSGFEVVAKGDILIHGTTEHARLDSGGNIVVLGGARGERTRLQAEGDIELRFLERGRVFAGGNILARQGLMHARVHAHGAVHCEPKSKVVGGQVIAGGDIVLGVVGSGRSTPTLVAAGTSPANLQRYYEIQRKLSDAEAKVQAYYARHGILVDNDTIARLRARFAEIKAEWQALDMVPEDLQGADRLVSIRVLGEVHAETSLRIGNAMITLEERQERRRFVLGEDGATILALEL